MHLLFTIRNAIAVIIASTLLAGGAGVKAPDPAQTAPVEEAPAYQEDAAEVSGGDLELGVDVSGRFAQPKAEAAAEKAKAAAEQAFERVTGRPPFEADQIVPGETGGAPADAAPDQQPAPSGESWESWGESVGDNWESWGESYGDSWGSWGESVGDFFDHSFDF